MSTTKISNGESNLNVDSFNLVDRPWIPVVDASGKTSTVGLRELFERAEELVDLATGTLETIALYRLLFCIAQRALGDLEDEYDWQDAQGRLQDAAVAYLEGKKDRFDLFDEKYPFLQIAKLTPKKTDAAELNKTDKLDFGLAVGNSSTLFDQNAVEEGRTHSPEWLAIKLLTFQCFSPGGLIGSSNWEHITENQPGRSSNAPCTESNMLITILKGGTLAQTIGWNLLTKEQLNPNDDLEADIINKPVWECDVLGNPQERDSLKYSFLGRLVPLSRFIRLDNCQNMVLSGGIIYAPLPQYRESMATVFYDANEKKLKYLRTDPERSPWRNLHAFLAWNRKERTGGALALSNLTTIFDNGARKFFSIWIGGITTDKAKIIDAVNWTVRIRSDLRGDKKLANYEKGVTLANSTQQRLVNAIKKYHEWLKLEPQNSVDKKSSNVSKAKRFFWSALERSQGVLQECAVNNNLNNLDDWKKILNDECLNVYERVCSRLTPRQLEAYTQGKKALFTFSKGGKKKKDVSKKVETKGKEK